MDPLAYSSGSLVSINPIESCKQIKSAQLRRAAFLQTLLWILCKLDRCDPVCMAINVVPLYSDLSFNRLREIPDNLFESTSLFSLYVNSEVQLCAQSVILECITCVEI